MPTAKKKPLNAYDEVPNPKSPPGVKPAKQEFKDDCDLNSIMRKFQKTGTIDHSAKHQAEYGLQTPQTLHDALNIVTRAQTMLNELPSSLRKKFKNSAADFLTFVQDEKNYEEAQELGLQLSPEAASAAIERINAKNEADAAASLAQPAAAATDPSTAS